MNSSYLLDVFPHRRTHLLAKKKELGTIQRTQDIIEDDMTKVATVHMLVVLTSSQQRAVRKNQDPDPLVHWGASVAARAAHGDATWASCGGAALKALTHMCVDANTLEVLVCMRYCAILMLQRSRESWRSRVCVVRDQLVLGVHTADHVQVRIPLRSERSELPRCMKCCCASTQRTKWYYQG